MNTAPNLGVRAASAQQTQRALGAGALDTSSSSRGGPGMAAPTSSVLHLGGPAHCRVQRTPGSMLSSLGVRLQLVLKIAQNASPMMEIAGRLGKLPFSLCLKNTAISACA